MMAMKLFAFNLLACMKKDIVAEFGNITVQSVFEEVIEFPAVVKAEADWIVVTFYGNYKEKHKVAVETLLRRLDVTGRNSHLLSSRFWRGFEQLRISPGRDSDPRSPPYQGGALPLCYQGRCLVS